MVMFFRNIPLAEANVTNVIISYYIEAVNAMIISITVPFIYVTGIQPLPMVVAQMFVVSSFCFGPLIVALGSAVSCFQIIYVTQFEHVFTLDPHTVGKKTFIFLISLIFIPNTIYAIIKTVDGSHVDKDVTLFTQGEYVGKGFQFPVIYALFWTGLFFVLSSIAFVFIPLLFKKIYQNPLLMPHRTKWLKRYMFGSLGMLLILIISVIMTNQNESRRLPINGLFTILALLLLLVYHLTEKDVQFVVKRHIFALFNIEESSMVTGSSANEDLSRHSQQLQSTLGSAVSQTDTKPRSIIIAVRPLDCP